MHRNGETEVTGESVVALPMGTLRPKMAYIYTLKQIGELLRAVKATGDWNALTVFTMLHLMYAAGLRLHEPIKLRIQDVNLKSRTIFIERSKFGKSRRIPIGKRALQYLRAYAEARRQRFGTPKRDERFFVNRLELPMNPPSVYKEFRRGRRQAGLLNVQASRPPRIHDLRHAFAVHRVHKWYTDGENPQSKLVLLSIYMGHREVTYTAHYLQMGAEVLRLGGQGFQAAFEDLAPEARGD
jgi:integrase